MTNAGAALAGEVADPVAAGGVAGIGAWECCSVGLRAGEDVMAVRRVAAAVDDLAFFGERGVFGQVVLVAVQLGDAAGDEHAFGVVPRPGADAVLGVDRRVTGGAVLAQVRLPG